MKVVFEDLTRRKVYSEVGRCIYCEDSDCYLTTEHLLPAGLLGKHELPKSSCKSCEKKTGRIEGKLLRGPFWPVRAKFGINSGRKKGEQPDKFDRKFWRGENAVILSEPKSEYPLYLPFPVFDLPAKLTGRDWLPDGEAEATDIVSFDDYSALLTIKRSLSRANATKVEIGRMIDPEKLRRFVAKVLHGYAIANLSSEFEPVLGDFIRGKDTGKAGYYVGSFEPHYGPIHKNLDTSRAFGAGLFAMPKGRYSEVYGGLKLFFPFLTTCYIAYLGRIPRPGAEGIQLLPTQIHT